MEQLWYGAAVKLDVYIILDENRLSAADLQDALHDIGQFGFGRDASIGLGKFEVEAFEPFALPGQTEADAFLALAPCAPQGLGFASERSFYQPFTRFGRHGDLGVHLQGGPFKAPVLLAQTGGVFSPSQKDDAAGALFIGQGLGGDGTLSKTIKETVHQGYAPALAIRLPDLKDAL
jgi:CRISPR-associated protein Csm4